MNIEKPETAVEKGDGDLNGPERSVLEGKGFIMKDAGRKEQIKKTEGPQYLDGDPRYQSIVEEVALSSLKEHNTAEFNEKFSGEVSAEGYLLDIEGRETDLRPNDIALLSPKDMHEADLLFEKLHPQEAKEYAEKEISRIYDDPEKDPALFVVSKEIFAKANSIYKDLSNGKDEDWLAIRSQVGALYWKEFVKNYPEKARSYAEKGYDDLKKALEGSRNAPQEIFQDKREKVEELNEIRGKLELSGKEADGDDPENWMQREHPITAEWIHQEAKFFAPDLELYRTSTIRTKTIELLKEFKKISKEEIDSLSESGKTANGNIFESSAMGELEPEAAKVLASEFKKIRLAPNFLISLIDLPSKALEKLDDFFMKKTEEGVARNKEKVRLRRTQETKEAEDKSLGN
ncbi:MAG: hypothetical protein WC926_02895 [Candidatus Paceibacterota bacterium]|jgi:hypothetical protein